MADDDELITKVVGTLIQQLNHCDQAQQYNVLELFNAVSESIRRGRDLSPLARYARTFSAGCPHTEVT